MFNESFDPLKAKYNGNEEVVIIAQKREIKNILNSYVGWFDPFCEMIQNALDAVDKRKEEAGEPTEYQPTIHIKINLKENAITVTDNGVGFTKAEYKKFLAPNFSFKSGSLTRGHKGVGATYLAYGFNYFQIATKTPEFEANGVMRDARKWLKDDAPAANPEVIPETEPLKDKSYFDSIEQGTQMTIICDSDSYPKELSWLGLATASSWMKVLRARTGLGQVNPNNGVTVLISVIDKDGITTSDAIINPSYLSVSEFIPEKAKDIDEIKSVMDDRYAKYGPGYRMPSKYTNLEAVYGIWDTDKLISELRLKDEELNLVKKYSLKTIFSYVYSLQVWEKINEKVGIRKGSSVLQGGMQLAANNMPQGELIQIPLTKNIGRQKQANILIHFDNCSADLGRKGFKNEITELGKDISRKMMDGPLNRIRQCFKANSGAAPDLRRENDLSEWKRQMTAHEKEYPLSIDNPNFFDPVKSISITSVPTREQDVIALFNQLIAGGVVRDVKIMSTNERSTYDSLFRIVVEEPKELQVFDKEKNPLGVNEEVFDELVPDGTPFITDPKVLEYKYSLDGLIEDFESGVKDANDISLVVAWESGTRYKDNYSIESMLISGNETIRQYHGVTHKLTNSNTNTPVCDLILLKDLILYLNNDSEGTALQESYDE